MTSDKMFGDADGNTIDEPGANECAEVNPMMMNVLVECSGQLNAPDEEPRDKWKCDKVYLINQNLDEGEDPPPSNGEDFVAEFDDPFGSSWHTMWPISPNGDGQGWSAGEMLEVAVKQGCHGTDPNNNELTMVAVWANPEYPGNSHSDPALRYPRDDVAFKGHDPSSPEACEKSGSKSQESDSKKPAIKSGKPQKAWVDLIPTEVSGPVFQFDNVSAALERAGGRLMLTEHRSLRTSKLHIAAPKVGWFYGHSELQFVQTLVSPDTRGGSSGFRFPGRPRQSILIWQGDRDTAAVIDSSCIEQPTVIELDSSKDIFVQLNVSKGVQNSVGGSFSLQVTPISNLH